MGGNFAKAVIVGKMCEFVELRGVISCDLACPEGAPRNGCVKDVDCGFVDGTFGHIAFSKGYRQSHQQEENLVGGGGRQCVSECGCVGNFACLEGGS